MRHMRLSAACLALLLSAASWAFQPPERQSAVAGKAFVAGDRFTAADVYVGSQIDWGLQFGTIPSRPAFEAYVAPLRERAGYKRAKEIDNGLIAEMQAAGTAPA